LEFLIIGSFGRVGFQLCRLLLEEGYPVQHVGIVDHWMDEDLEEKRMWVERNSNFSDYQPGTPLVEESKILLPVSDWSNTEKTILEETVIGFLLDQGKREPNIISFSIFAEDGDQWAQRFYNELKEKISLHQLLVYPKAECVLERTLEKDNPVFQWLLSIITSSENGIFHFKGSGQQGRREKDAEIREAKN